MCQASSSRMLTICCGLALLLLAFVSTPAFSQGTLADYQRGTRIRALIEAYDAGVPEHPTWIAEGHRFWYRRLAGDGHEFIIVDAESRQRQPAFDHVRLATAFSAAAHHQYAPHKLPFDSIGLADHGRVLEFVVHDTIWHCDLAAYTCISPGVMPASWVGPRAWAPPRPIDNRPRTSPDGKQEAVIQNYNVAVRNVGESRLTILSTDGSEGNYYDLRSIVWSRDSKRLAVYRVIPGYHRVVHVIESSPTDQLQPKERSFSYAKPGDVLDDRAPVIFDVSSRREITVDDSLFPNAYSVTPLVWRHDGRALTFEYNQRGHQVYRVIEIDAVTGRTRSLIDERMPTFVNYSQKHFRYDVADGKEIIWMSERDGWNHLYLYDGANGHVQNRVTTGDWIVRGVDWVDTTKRQIWFHASGMNPKQDPYFVHYYRVGFDGSGLVALTQADGNHTVTYSADHTYYVDTWSRVNLAPISQLRRASDGAVLTEIARGNYDALTAAGWRPPEVFTAKGRDAKTDILGIIVRPMHFDPSRKYPVIESIYAGPHGSFVPKSFSLADSSLQKIGEMQNLAELGFIVVEIDGMGTSNRSKAFNDVAWKNLKDAGFEDRILWHKAVAAKYSSYDISNVGIYGLSAGGQNALGALLFHPEFYKVAVSHSGSQDNRMDKIWWNEQWMGWPIGPQYAASSNVDNAYRLQGRLLLTVGEMDTNVDPASTMQVVNALIKANKTFDLLVIPGADHTAGGAYGERKRFDFFVHNILGIEPPAWNQSVLAATSSDR